VVVGCVLVLENVKRKRKKESQHWVHQKQEKVENQKQKVKSKSRKENHYHQKSCKHYNVDLWADLLDICVISNSKLHAFDANKK